jgi:hypothetical protein
MTTQCFHSGQKVRITNGGAFCGQVGFIQRTNRAADRLAKRGLRGLHYLVNTGHPTHIPGWEAGRWCRADEIEVAE